MENMDLRQAIKSRDLRFNEIASEMGITPQHFSKLMSEKLSAYNFNRIIDAVNSLVTKRGENADG